MIELNNHDTFNDSGDRQSMTEVNNTQWLEWTNLWTIIFIPNDNNCNKQSWHFLCCCCCSQATELYILGNSIPYKEKAQHIPASQIVMADTNCGVLSLVWRTVGTMIQIYYTNRISAQFVRGMPRVLGWCISFELDRQVRYP